jgi:predicted DCC family thiol-disulfide oxidoreductase YuxK
MFIDRNRPSIAWKTRHAAARLIACAVGAVSVKAQTLTTAAQPAPAYPLRLLYDRACLICRSEMHALAARDREGRLELVDISARDFDAGRWGATHAHLNARIHAVDARGVTLIGVPALRAAYGAVGLGAWVAPTGWPLLAPLAAVAYDAFARHRYVISRAAAPLIGAVAAWRARRTVARMDACAGACDIARRGPAPGLSPRVPH